MTLLVSETSLVANGPSFQMGGCSQIVLHDEDDSSEVLDIDEYIPNREVVNLENADVNIQGSTGVTIGPVTHVNVSGNVTIYSNGNVADDVEHKSIESGEHNKPGINSHGKGRWRSLLMRWKNFPVRRTISFQYLKIVGILLTLVLSGIAAYVILHYYKTTHGEDDEESYYGNRLGSHKVYYKNDWGGSRAKAVVPLAHPTDLVIISHSGSASCDSFQSCSGLVKTFQGWHLSLGNNDIGYNFLVGGDGDVYVGRGWDVRNFHNGISIGISFVGDYNFDELNDGMIEVAELLIQQGLQLRKLSQDYVLIGHNQSSTAVPISPGENVYRVIKNWPHFSNKTYFNNT